MGVRGGRDGSHRLELAVLPHAHDGHAAIVRRRDVQVRQLGAVRDPIHSLAALRFSNRPAAVGDVDGDCLPFVAAHEDKTARHVERDTPRSAAGVWPLGDDGVGADVHGDGRIAKGVRVRAALHRVDDERLGAAGHGDGPRARERGGGSGLQPEGLDGLPVRLGDPDLLRRFDPADVIRTGGELCPRHDALGARIDDGEGPIGAVDREDVPLPRVG